MKKTAIVYWSGSGNTETMANAIAEGVKAAGGEADVISVDAFDAGKAAAYDAVAFGCPAMGDEELEDTEFAPVYEACIDAVKEKPVALFGSYGWGDGEWMRTWTEDAAQKGLQLVEADGLICNEDPDEEGLEACRALGAKLAG